jgi:hypothetical protein
LSDEIEKNSIKNKGTKNNMSQLKLTR